MARRTLLSVCSFALALTLVEFGTARADWLDDAWGADRVEMTGNPAITIYGDTIDIVLPTATLYRAYEEGLTTQDILDVFLDRYGQRCSGMVDLNMPHPDLKVGLSLQSPSAFKDTSERDDVLATLKRTYLSQRTEGSTPLLFTILPEHFDFSINYVPTHHITCVVPNEGGPTT